MGLRKRKTSQVVYDPRCLLWGLFQDKGLRKSEDLKIEGRVGGWDGFIVSTSSFTEKIFDKFLRYFEDNTPGRTLKETFRRYVMVISFVFSSLVKAPTPLNFTKLNTRQLTINRSGSFYS